MVAHPPSSRRVRFTLCLAALLAAMPLALRAAEPDDAYGLPPASELIDTVLAALPDIPIQIKADLQSKDPKGNIERVLKADIRLDWNPSKPWARYTIRDAFGKNLEGLDIRYAHDGKTRYRYYEGENLIMQEMPDLSQCIQDTDITWQDLSLAFLWWDNGQTIGTDTVKGRSCYVADLPAPAEADGQEPYGGVRVWIDPQARMLLQVAAYNRDREVMRVLKVKSLKKVKDLWMIQNLDVQTRPSRHKTSLRVRKVTAERANEE